MNIGTAARLAYFKVEALEALLVAKGILETNEAEVWRHNRVKDESERREAEWMELWDTMEDGDLIRFRAHHRNEPSEGTLIAKSKVPWRALTITATIKTRWGRYKGREYTFHNIVQNEVTVVRHKDGPGEHCT